MREFLKSIGWGAKYNPRRFAYSAFVSFSVCWTLIEGITYLTNSEFQGPTRLFIVIALSLLFAIYNTRMPLKVEFPISNTNTILEISYGDIFNHQGLKVIAVNEYFDSKLGTPVSKKSLHGKLITECFGGHPASFDEQIEDALREEDSIEVPEKIDGKTKKYNIGTTVRVHAKDQHFLCFALSQSDPKTCKAYADVGIMWVALKSLLRKAREEASGDDLILPLIGGGQSGVGLPYSDLLNLLILAVINESKERITGRIIIALSPNRLHEINLRTVISKWR